MDLNHIIGHIQEQNNHNPEINDQRIGYLSILLIGISFLSRAALYLVDNYDTLFKLLSLASLALVCLVNSGKLIEQLITNYKKIKEIFKFKK